MDIDPLSGAFAPVLTPFRADLSIDKPSYLRFCAWLLSQGVGLAAFGTNSEANSLSAAERLDLLEALIAAGVPPSKLLPGTGTSALPDTVALTRAACTAGVAGVLMLPPFYYKDVGEDGVFASFAEVIERVGDARLRVCLYHFPKLSGVPVTLPLIGRLLKRYPGAIAGVKDSSGDIANTLALIREYPGLRVFCGTEALLLRTMRSGGAGCISAGANVNPAAIAGLAAAWNAPEAEAKQEAISRLRAVIEAQPVIAALKAICARHGGKPEFSTLRPPLQRLNLEQEAGLMTALAAQGFQMPGLHFA